MFDPKSLLDQFLGGSGTGGFNAGGMRSAGKGIKDRLDQQSGSGGFVRGAAAGGLLGLLLGGKGLKNMAGGALGYGGAAVIGALALQAYQKYQQQKGAGPSLSPAQFASLSPDALPHAQPAADGSPFQLVLVRAMIGAAKADGHVDADEHQRLFAEVERLGLDSEAKAFVFDLLSQPVDLGSIAGAVATPEQGAEVYLASRMAINPDVPAERAYLDALAARLKLPPELRLQLEQQVDG
ncbi:MAG TPA: tellurite resistance TerB family protein [Steroidobacteraceae bacterium]|nr:tellurite resistance TerB family protein [Steroidobacteraceae bacterium]